MKPTVYLAGPIDDVQADEALGWRQQAAHALNAEGFTCYNPCGAFLCTSPVDSAGFITLVNETALRAASFVLVYLDGPGKAIGTIREMELAVRLGKPVLVVYQSANQHVALHDVTICSSVVDAVSRILKARHQAVRSNEATYAVPSATAERTA